MDVMFLLDEMFLLTISIRLLLHSIVSIRTCLVVQSAFLLFLLCSGDYALPYTYISILIRCDSRRSHQQRCKGEKKKKRSNHSFFFAITSNIPHHFSSVSTCICTMCQMKIPKGNLCKH